MTVTSTESGLTQAFVAIHPVHARGSVQTRVRSAVVDVNAACSTSESRLADAVKVGQVVDARAIVETGLSGAVVNVLSAVLAGVAHRTDAVVVPVSVVAGPAVAAWIVQAFVNVRFTVLALESRFTLTRVIAIISRWPAQCPIVAAISRARLSLELASLAEKSRCTVTDAGVSSVDAEAVVQARIVYAVVDNLLAVLAAVSTWTSAVVVVEPVRADTAVLTGIRRAFVDLFLAVESGESSRATALHRSRQVVFCAYLSYRTFAHFTWTQLCLTVLSSESRWTLAFAVSAQTTVQTAKWRACAAVIAGASFSTRGASKSIRTRALEAVQSVDTDALVLAGIRVAHFHQSVA